MAQRLKRLPAMQETWVRSLSQEDPLEKEMATHSSILAWRISWTEEPGGLQSTGSQSRTRLREFTFTFTTSWKESYDQPRKHIEKQRHYFVNKGPSSQGYGFSSSHVWMWEMDHKAGWMPKNWCFKLVLEKTLESPLGCKEIKPVNPKGNQSWIFIGSTDAEAEVPILWPPDAKNWLFGKDPDAGKDWRQEEKGITEDEMVEWYHWLNGHEFEQAPGVGDGQGGLACCNPWGHKESDTTEWLNWTDNSETARRKRWTGQGVRKELPCPL